MDAIKALDPSRGLPPGLPQPYLDLHAPQKNRPAAIGSFCVHSPKELVLAVDGIHLRINAIKRRTQPKWKKSLLIKSLLKA